MKLTRTFAILATLSLLLISCQEEDIPTNIDKPVPTPPSGETWSVNGSVQKGPFTQGTSITVQALDASLNPTGSQYQTKTTDDAGSFAMDSQIESRYVEIIAMGYYFNEIEGKVSSSTITLRSISDLEEEGKTNVNLLTTLESDRVRALVKEGKTVADARTQAENEIFAVFNIPVSAGSVANFDKMDITGGAVADAILLAVSASLQAGRSVGELSELISKIASDIASSGELVTESLRAKIIEGCTKVDADKVRDNLEKRYADLGKTDFIIPPFEDYLDVNGNGVIDRDDSWIILGQSDFVISDRGGTFDVSLQHSQDFEVIVEDGWVRQIDTKAYLQDAVLHFEVDPNEDVDPRYAVIRIKDSKSSYSESVTLTQKQKDALTLSKLSVELEKQACTFEVEYNHNADVAVTMDVDWIRTVATKTLATSKATFSVDANPETTTRTGHITFTLGELRETLTVYQKGGRTLVLSEKEVSVGSEGGTVSLRVSANVPFEVIGPDAGWLTSVSGSSVKAIVSHTYSYKAEENVTGSTRSAVITFRDTESDLSETVTVTQAQNDVFTGEKSEYRISFEGGTVEIPVSTNLNYTPSIEQDGSWLSIVETKAIRNETIVLKATKNETISPRTAVLKLLGENRTLSFNIVQGANAEQVTVTVTTPGTLTQQMSAEDLHKVLNLKIAGTLNDTDLAVLEGGVWVEQGVYAGSDPAHFECEWVVETLDLSEMKTESSTIGKGRNFFCCVPSLLKVVMPREVETIEESCFNKCINLKEIDWGTGSSVSKICGRLYVNSVIGLSNQGYYGAFKDCISLESVTLPESLSDFQAGAFLNCSSLKTLVFPDGGKLRELKCAEAYKSTGLSTTVYVMGHLWGCTSLETIVLPSNLREIGENAFYGTPFRTINVPETVKYISTEYLFNGCERLEEVILPSTITEYSKGMFSGCAKLASIKGPAKITKYCESCFEGCPSKWIVLDPEAEYESGVFAGMDVESISFPAGFKTVPHRMFAQCKNLKSLSLGEVQTIGEYAFGSCALKALTIPESVKDIDASAFSSNSELSEVRIDAVNITLDRPFYDVKLSRVTIGKGVRSIDGPLGGEVSEIFFEEGGVCEYFASAGSQKALKSITLPSTLKTIGDEAFYDCTITSIDIPVGVTSIGVKAFNNCGALTSVSLPDGLEDIGSNAFGKCNKLEKITIPYTVAGIGKEAFYGCSYLEEVHMKSIDPPYIGSRVFENCKYLSKIQVPDEGLSAYKAAWSDWADLIVGGEAGGQNNGSSLAASVTTLDASEITFTKATLNGKVSVPKSMGDLYITARFYYSNVYKTVEDLKLSGESYGVASYDFEDDGSFSGSYGFSSGTTYWYVAYAKVGSEEYWGEVKSFTTGGVSIYEPSMSADGRSATFSGSLNIPESLKNQTVETYFLLGTTDNYFVNSATRVDAIFDGDRFSATAENLTPGTKYYWAAYVKVGDSWEYSGWDYTGGLKSFVAAPEMSVTTGTAELASGKVCLKGTVSMVSDPSESGVSPKVVFYHLSSSNFSIAGDDYDIFAMLLNNGEQYEADWTYGIRDVTVQVPFDSGAQCWYVLCVKLNDEIVSRGETKSYTCSYNFPSGAVDLGLSVKWASCNAGAASPDAYGDYLAYDGFSSTEGRLPTSEEFTELIENCTWTRTERNGVTGYVVAGNNLNAIFIPCAGMKYNGNEWSVGRSCYYWSSTMSDGRVTYLDGLSLRTLFPTGYMLPVRPVYE